MLCMTVKCGEPIVIRTPEGREIRVMVQRIESAYGGKVRVACEADREVEINRAEVDYAKQLEKSRKGRS